MKARAFFSRPLTLILILCAQTLSAETERFLVTSPSRALPELEKLNLQDTFAYRPSVNINSGSELEHLVAIRSPTLNAGAAAGSFISFLGPIPFRAIGYGNTNTFLGSPYELLSQEVLAGPQSQLGGIVHGAVTYQRALPSTHQQQTQQVGVLSDIESRYRLTGDFAGPTQALGLAADKSTGWRENSSFEQYKTHYQFRTQWSELTQNTQLYYYHLKQETAGYIYGKKSYRSKSTALASELEDGYRNASGLVALSTFEKGNHALTLYTRHHQMDFNMHWFPTSPTEENSHYSFGQKLEVELYQSRAFELNLDLDIDWTRAKLEESQTRPSLGGFIEGEHYDYQTTTLNKALNFSFLSQFHNDWRLQGGVRANKVKHKYQNNLESGDFGRYRRLPDRNDRYFYLSPYLALTYDLPKRSSLHLRYDGGGRIPEVNDLYRQLTTQKDESIPVERVQYFELKAQTITNYFNLEKTFYYMQKKNFYFRDADANNVLGQTRHYGMEGDLVTNFSDRWEWGIFWSLSEHRYDFNNNIEAAQNQSESITKGNQIEAAPKYQFSSFASYHFSDKTHLTLRWQQVSSSYLNAANQNKYSGHSLWDLALSTRWSNIRATLAVRNLFDARYARRADHFRGQYRYFPGRPRYVLASATMDF